MLLAALLLLDDMALEELLLGSVELTELLEIIVLDDEELLLEIAALE